MVMQDLKGKISIWFLTILFPIISDIIPNFSHSLIYKRTCCVSIVFKTFLTEDRLLMLDGYTFLTVMEKINLNTEKWMEERKVSIKAINAFNRKIGTFLAGNHKIRRFTWVKCFVGIRRFIFPRIQSRWLYISHGKLLWIKLRK